MSHSANAELLPSILGNGFGQTGVVLFFLISGYLLSSLYLGKNFSLQSVKGYLIRRAARIIPLYLSALILAGAALFVFDMNIYKNANYPYIIQSVLMIRGFNIFWTVPVEIHFYTIFLGIWFAISHCKIIYLLLLLILIQIFLLLTLPHILNGTNWLFYWLHIFLLGVGISQLQSLYHLKCQTNPSRKSSNWITLFALFFGAILLPPEVRVNLSIPTWARYEDPYVIIFLTFFLWHIVEETSYLNFLKKRVFRFTGMISFSIYIVHIPVLQLTIFLIEKSLLPSNLGFAFLIANTIIIASMTYAVIEKPMIKWSEKRVARYVML